MPFDDHRTCCVDRTVCYPPGQETKRMPHLLCGILRDSTMWDCTLHPHQFQDSDRSFLRSSKRNGRRLSAGGEQQNGGRLFRLTNRGAIGTSSFVVFTRNQQAVRGPRVTGQPAEAKLPATATRGGRVVGEEQAAGGMQRPDTLLPGDSSSPPVVQDGRIVAATILEDVTETNHPDRP